MSLSVQFHNLLERVNVLERPEDAVDDFLYHNPTIYKIVLLINHIFRVATMSFFMLALPFSIPVNLALCFSASLFYRLTVEGYCGYKFALPSFAGAITFPVAQEAVANLISKAALHSFADFALTIGSLLPFTAYVAYVVLTVDYDVDDDCGILPSCCKDYTERT
ncbi:MAG: hypothetical protein JSS30_01065 [Verrucomicrobia bacterium]|nr:hypothetical protein [Verrucomicrobiota bacterium]